MINTPKLWVASLGITAMTLLCALERVAAEVAAPGITGIVFYVLGNGLTARSGKTAEPVIAPRLDPHADEV